MMWEERGEGGIQLLGLPRSKGTRETHATHLEPTADEEHLLVRRLVVRKDGGRRWRRGAEALDGVPPNGVDHELELLDEELLELVPGDFAREARHLQAVIRRIWVVRRMRGTDGVQRKGTDEDSTLW
jgi:hypothetical protein